MDQNVLTSSQAAEYLGVTRQRVDQLGSTGTIPRSRLGSFWVYRPEDLDKWRKSSNRLGGRPKDDANLSMKNEMPALAGAL